MSGSHFTAVLTITETQAARPTAAPSNSYNRRHEAPVVEEPRRVEEVLKLTIRETSLERLEQKLAQHIGIHAATQETTS